MANNDFGQMTRNALHVTKAVAASPVITGDAHAQYQAGQSANFAGFSARVGAHPEGRRYFDVLRAAHAAHEEQMAAYGTPVGPAQGPSPSTPRQHTRVKAPGHNI